MKTTCFRFLRPLKQAGIVLVGSGRVNVASFLASEAFTSDRSRELWIRRAIWTALVRGVDSPGGHIVAQAQAQEIDWLNPEERREFEEDREFGRGGCWTPRYLRARPAPSRGSADCTRAQRAVEREREPEVSTAARFARDGNEEDADAFGEARAGDGPWGLEVGAQAPSTEDWARAARRLAGKPGKVEP